MVLSLSVWGLLRLFAALRWWDVLYEFDARLGPLYLTITGAGWLLGGGVLLWGAWRRRAWARLVVPAFIGLWLAAYWVERLFFQAVRPNLPFVLAASVLLLAVLSIITFHRSTEIFFTKSEEHD